MTLSTMGDGELAVSIRVKAIAMALPPRWEPANIQFFLPRATGFIAFAWDKHCARNGMWRTKESTLLLLAAVGGTVGSILGQRILRHKTKKQPFKTYLLSIICMQIAMAVVISFPAGRDFLFSLFVEA
jgi:uncharacterized membrane protein YsdA (DUF1294 family)